MPRDVGYTFNGRDEMTEAIDDDLDLFVTTDETVTLDSDGVQMSGELTRVVTTKCTGSTEACNALGFDDLKCTLNTDSVGVRADEAAEAVPPTQNTASE